ncbi:MAG TPA: hypothetical protein VMW95_02860 [Desulfobacterales bacterium]|nr:hypothetical protein [Desulfobacterales bacterium]
MNNSKISEGIGLFDRFAPNPMALIPSIKKLFSIYQEVVDVIDIISGKKSICEKASSFIFKKVSSKITKKPFKAILVAASRAAIKI